jgi:hypothetical protein
MFGHRIGEIDVESIRNKLEAATNTAIFSA